MQLLVYLTSVLQNTSLCRSKKCHYAKFTFAGDSPVMLNVGIYALAYWCVFDCTYRSSLCTWAFMLWRIDVFMTVHIEVVYARCICNEKWLQLLWVIPSYAANYTFDSDMPKIKKKSLSKISNNVSQGLKGRLSIRTIYDAFCLRRDWPTLWYIFKTGSKVHGGKTGEQ